MANPFAGIITSTFKGIHKNAIDSLLEDTALTIPCRLYFVDTNAADCPNCDFDPITGRSANRYTAGGPIPFRYGTICPYCNGKGKIDNTYTEDLNLMVVWDYRSWINFNINTQSPAGRVQTFSKINTLPSLKRANEIIIGTDIENYEKHRFQRDSEPEPCGLGSNDYIAVLWKRIG